MEGEAAVAILASEGLAQVAVSCQHVRVQPSSSAHFLRFLHFPSLLTKKSQIGRHELIPAKYKFADVSNPLHASTT